VARTVTPAITSALNSPVATPSLSAIILDTFDRPHACIINANAGRSAILQLAAGTWVRAYTNQPGLGSNASIYSQLITDPSNATQLNTYNLRSSTAAGQAGVALSLFGSTIFLFYQRQSDNHVCYQTSTDAIGWSAETVASSTTVRAWALASAGNNDLFIAQDAVAGHDESQNVILLTYSAGSFSVTATWTNPAVQINGLAAIFGSGTYRLALGAQSRKAGALALCTLTYNGSSWSPVTPVHPLDDPLTGISSPFPSLNLINNVYRLASTVYDSGSASGISGNRTELWTSPDFVHWYLEQLIGTSYTNGANIVTGQNGNGWILADAGTLLRSEASDGVSNPPIDVSDKLHSLHIKEPTNDKITAVATLDNHDGTLTPAYPPTSALRVGAQVQISLGYADANLADSTVPTHSLYIDRIDQVNAELPGQTLEYGTAPHAGDATTPATEHALTILHMSNRARRMERTIHTDKIHAGATLLFLAAEAAVAGGLPAAPTSPGTTQFSQTIDALTIAAPSTYRQVFDRLAHLYAFDWFVDENDQLQLREPLAGDASAFTYGTGTVQTLGHDLAPVRTANHVRIGALTTSGTPPAFADSFDFDRIQAHGETVHHRAADRLLSSSAQAAIRAGLEIRRAQRSAVDGWARLPLNPSHQPLDVITITDESLTTTARISSIEWSIDMNAGAFEQLARLEAP
jgi:hypothetical protein